MKPAVIPFNLVVKHEDTRSYTTPEENPPQQPLIQSALTTTSYSMFHPVIFEKLNGILIRSVAIRVQGAAGPAGLASEGACVQSSMVNLINCVRQLPS